jgi:arsenate reductase (glutaredoxin)
MPETTIYFNARCSKCRTAQGILSEKGVDATFVRYLETPPTVKELRRLMSLLGIDDPRAMMRTSEPDYAALGLGSTSSADELLEAIASHPILLERPIFVRDGRAVVGRPPERVLELLPPP